MMRLVLPLALLVAFTVTGCMGTTETTYHQSGIQCDPMLWDGDEYGGSEDERIARLLAHYEGLGLDIQAARIEHSDTAVPAVCGAWDASWYVMTVRGDFPQADDDGWHEGDPAPESY